MLRKVTFFLIRDEILAVENYKYYNKKMKNYRENFRGEKKASFMMAKKKRISALLYVLAACCLLAISLFFCETRPAYASTNTDGMWQNRQTQNLIPTIQSIDTWDSLVANGWGKDSDTPNLEVYETDKHGYGIRPSKTGSGADIGNHDYTGGIYYTVYLSEADQTKAKLGQLSITASAWYYLQAATDYDLSVRAEFHKVDGTDIETKSTTVEDHLGGVTDSVRQLNLEKASVPAGTAYVEMWFSNSKSLNGRPWIADMQAYLHDTTAPSFTQATLDDNGVIDPENNIAIEGNAVKYCIQFNEKVFVETSGTATLNLDGQQFVTSSTTEAIDENGKTSVRYSFTLPESQNSGTLSLSPVSELKVKDEAGNEFTYNGSPSVDTLQYYGTMSVTTELTNIDKTDGENTAQFGTDYTATLRAAKGYDLPTSVEIKVGGVPIASNGYAYDSVSGNITIYGSYIKGDISIKAAGIAKKNDVTFDKQNGSDGTDTVTAEYDTQMPNITAPLRTGYTFAGYYTQSGGSGTKYYDEAGKGVSNCDFDEPLTLYAHWSANRYTIEFDGNKPDNASGDVTGNTSSAGRTYDDGEKSLPSNDFALTGWTFQGWATSASGSVVYENGAEVINLTAANGGTFNLYAVWKANTYTIVYNSNKPSGASGTVTGTTVSSSHTYDTQKALTTNGFTLTG